MFAIDAAVGLLSCPVCLGTLARRDRTLICPSGHSFDIARQGYVNLLRTAAPANADTTEMVAARERFFATGHYAAIAAALAERASGASSIAEVGAGTGYYLTQAIKTQHPDAHLALDISVAAARRAARAGLAAVVSDTWQRLPVTDGSLGVLLCVFAPRNAAEFARVLAGSGRVLVVTPEADHLQQLRIQHQLLGIEPGKLRRLDTDFTAAGLHLVERSTMRYDTEMSPGDLVDLIAMGPNAFHAGQHLIDGAQRVTVAVTVSNYRKAR